MDYYDYDEHIGHSPGQPPSKPFQVLCGYPFYKRIVPDMTGHVRASSKYKPDHYGAYGATGYRYDKYNYFSPIHYQVLYPRRYMKRMPPQYTYDTHWAYYKGPWYDCTEDAHYKRWFNLFYDAKGYRAHLIDNV